MMILDLLRKVRKMSLITIAICVFALGGWYGYTRYYPNVKDDNVVEEIVEEVVKEASGIEIDLTPESEER